jgi:hypothetical protein
MNRAPETAPVFFLRVAQAFKPAPCRTEIVPNGDLGEQGHSLERLCHTEAFIAGASPVNCAWPTHRLLA